MTRTVPPFENGVGVFYAALNRGNRSCAINLRVPEGVDALCSLLPHYDVLIEGFRPGVMELHHPRAKTFNENIVMGQK